MGKLSHLFTKNREWSERIRQQEPEFFAQLAQQQTPEYLWIGCSDSRVPSNQIIGLPPGEVFVHRNVANIVVHTDMNCLSVMQYAIEVLKVKHLIVCGHYGCGGVSAALGTRKFGLIDNWLRHIQDVAQKHAAHLSRLADDAARVRRLCELNVIEQVVHACQTTVVSDAWERAQDLTIHGWVYGLDDGLVHDLGVSVDAAAQLADVYRAAMEKLEK